VLAVIDLAVDFDLQAIVDLVQAMLLILLVQPMFFPYQPVSLLLVLFEVAAEDFLQNREVAQLVVVAAVKQCLQLH